MDESKIAAGFIFLQSEAMLELLEKYWWLTTSVGCSLVLSFCIVKLIAGRKKSR